MIIFIWFLEFQCFNKHTKWSFYGVFSCMAVFVRFLNFGISNENAYLILRFSVFFNEHASFNFSLGTELHKHGIVYLAPAGGLSDNVYQIFKIFSVLIKGEYIFVFFQRFFAWQFSISCILTKYLYNICIYTWKEVFQPRRG